MGEHRANQPPTHSPPTTYLLPLALAKTACAGATGKHGLEASELDAEASRRPEPCPSAPTCASPLAEQQSHPVPGKILKGCSHLAEAGAKSGHQHHELEQQTERQAKESLLLTAIHSEIRPFSFPFIYS